MWGERAVIGKSSITGLSDAAWGKVEVCYYPKVDDFPSTAYPIVLLEKINRGILTNHNKEYNRIMI